MKIYYYHTRPIKEAYDEWLEHKHPGHILYGLTEFEKYDIACILHKYKKEKIRFGSMLRNLKEILFCKEPFDLIYATSFRGLELIIFLRALGLYKKPIAIWHHTAIVSSPNKLKNAVSRFFYKGIDHLFFFSSKLIELSVETGKVKREQAHLIHWGPDLDFYDRLLARTNKAKCEFISTGKENRDFISLMEAFRDNDATIDMYVPKTNGDLNYQRIFDNLSNIPHNVHLHHVSGILPYELGLKVAEAECVTLCSLKPPYSYPVGLTSLAEAIGMGKPVICSKNPFWEMDIAEEGAGITVSYGDSKGWHEAVKYIAEHKQEARIMGKKGRELAEKSYNLDILSKEIVDVLKGI